MPLYTILLAMGNPTVHYFSLDIEGAEFPILKTIPWDKVMRIRIVLVSLQNDENCRQVDIRVLSVETHLAGRIYPGDRKDLIAYMEKVIQKTIRMTIITIQVGYRHIHWAHQSTNDNRKAMGTNDDLFVRNDVPLVKEEGWDAEEALKEKLGENDIEELVTEELENLLDSGKMGLVASDAKREEL